MRVLARGIAWLFGVVVLAGVGLRPHFGDELVVTRYTGYVLPWLLLGLVAGIAWACVTRSSVLATVMSLSAAIIVGNHVPFFWRESPVSPPRGMTLEVMSYNTWSRNSDARRIASVVLEHAPDLLLLQEIRPEVFDSLMNELRNLYGERAPHFAYDASIQQGMVSRYPLEPRAAMKRKGQAQEVVVRSPAGPITVFNVHPLRTGGWRHRYDQIGALLEEEVLPERSPVILGGDLNVTEHSQMYALLSAHLQNAHQAAGSAFGFTYPSALRVLATLPALPMARIDHIFSSEHFVTLRAGTLAKSGGSDHRPVFAALVVRAPEESASPPPAPRSARGAPGRSVTTPSGDGRSLSSNSAPSKVGTADRVVP